MDWGAVGIVLLTIVFTGVLVGFLYAEMNRRYILEHWVEYRCHPVIMPFASFFGKDTVQNFNYCIMQTNSGFFGFLLEPIYYMFSMVGSILSDLTQGIDDIRSMMTSIRGGFMGILGIVFGKMAGTTSEVVVLFTRLRDVLARMMGVFVTLTYTANASISTGSSIMNGPIGTVVNYFCFAKDTPIRLFGSAAPMPIQSVRIGDVLSDGSRVTSVLKFTSEGADMFELDGITVSGSHLIFKNNAWQKVRDCSGAIPVFVPSWQRIYCLNTDTHNIQVEAASESLWFRDFEEVSAPAAIEAIQTLTSECLNKGRVVPEAVTGSYASGLAAGTKVLLKGNRRLYVEGVEIGDELVGGGVVTGIATHEVESSDAGFCIHNDVAMLPDTLVLHNGNYIRAANAAAQGNGLRRTRAYHLFVSNGEFTVIGDAGVSMKVRDDQEVYDEEMNDVRDAIVMEHVCGTTASRHP
jgi:hypothetical protein